MERMSIDEAFSLLDVPLDADEEQIKQRYYEKSKIHHPDKLEGDHEIQAKLNEAYDIASAYSKIRYSVIRLETSDLLETLSKALETQRPSLDAEATAQRIKKRKTKHLQRMKVALWVIGGIAGIFALFGKELFPLLYPKTDNQSPSSFENLLKLLSFTFGVAGLILQMIITRIGNRIDAFMENISERQDCALELATCLRFEDIESFCEYDITLPIGVRSLPPPWETLLDTSVEFRRVLLKKSLEHGLIEVVRQESFTPDSVDTYRLRFRPGLFKPRHEPNKKPETKPMTREEARSLIIFGGVWFLALGGLTTYLIVVSSSLWSILTGILAFLGVGLFGIGIEGLMKKPKKELEQA